MAARKDISEEDRKALEAMVKKEEVHMLNFCPPIYHSGLLPVAGCNREVARDSPTGGKQKLSYDITHCPLLLSENILLSRQRKLLRPRRGRSRNRKMSIV